MLSSIQGNPSVFSDSGEGASVRANAIGATGGLRAGASRCSVTETGVQATLQHRGGGASPADGGIVSSDGGDDRVES